MSDSENTKGGCSAVLSSDGVAATRYFLVGYTFGTGTQTGTGNLWFGKQTFPSNMWLKEEAARGRDFTADAVVVTHITELSPDDFQLFIGG